MKQGTFPSLSQAPCSSFLSGGNHLTFHFWFILFFLFWQTRIGFTYYCLLTVWIFYVILCLHLRLCDFQRFLAGFSQFSRKFPGRCEEKSKSGWKSGRFRDYSGRFGKYPKSLENRLGASPRGFESLALRQEQTNPNTRRCLLFYFQNFQKTFQIWQKLTQYSVILKTQMLINIKFRRYWLW